MAACNDFVIPIFIKPLQIIALVCHTSGLFPGDHLSTHTNHTDVRSINKIHSRKVATNTLITGVFKRILSRPFVCLQKLDLFPVADFWLHNAITSHELSILNTERFQWCHDLKHMNQTKNRGGTSVIHIVRCTNFKVIRDVPANTYPVAEDPKQNKRRSNSNRVSLHLRSPSMEHCKYSS